MTAAMAASRAAVVSSGIALESRMTNGEQNMLLRGLAAGMLIGVAIGVIIALFIVMKPHSGIAFVGVGIAAFTAAAISLWTAIRSQTNRDDQVKGPKRR
jgi:hypothetical protein